MSNLEKWRAAKEMFEEADAVYMAARDAVITAGDKRGAAWFALEQAAHDLSEDEKAQAILHEFGPRG